MKLLRVTGDEVPWKHGWIVLALFALTVALLGGSSRPDAIQMVGLRPIAALFLIPILYCWSGSRMRVVKAPLILLGLLAAWMLLQIVPLPASLWQSLPGTAPVKNLSVALGMADVWRPVSFVPFRTTNALASLIVPFVALALPAVLLVRRTTIFFLIIAISLLCAVLGVMQITSGSDSALYFYEFSNRGTLVGFFANRNHTAVLFSLALVTIAYVSFDESRPLPHNWQRIFLSATYIVILAAALVSGSRAGFLTTVIALSASVGLMWLHSGAMRNSRRKKTVLPLLGTHKLVAPIAALTIAALVSVFAMFGRFEAFDRMFGETQILDLRWSLLPVLMEMARTYFVFGAGFGTFEGVYHIHEPTALLAPEYVNMAHNDWIQFVIEGGLPSITLLAAFLIWAVRRVRADAGLTDGGLQRPLYWLSVFLIIAIASAADYPLRAPLFQAVAVWLVAALCMESVARPSFPND